MCWMILHFLVGEALEYLFFYPLLAIGGLLWEWFPEPMPTDSTSFSESLTSTGDSVLDLEFCLTGMLSISIWIYALPFFFFFDCSFFINSLCIFTFSIFLSFSHFCLFLYIFSQWSLYSCMGRYTRSMYLRRTVSLYFRYFSERLVLCLTYFTIWSQFRFLINIVSPPLFFFRIR